MNPWFQCLSRISRPSAPRACWLGILALLLTAASAPAAPEYALSGQAPELAGAVLAQTPAGPVTALDVLMFDEMRDRSLTSVPIKAWLNPTALESTPYRMAIKNSVERLLAYQSLARQAGDWQPLADDVRVKSFGAATAVWIEKVVKPQVKVMEITDPASGRTSGDIDRYYLAHPEKYLRRLRAQIRYIFMAANTLDPAGKAEVRAQLEAVAQQIQDGKISFADAARKNSQAASAAQGGLLPPFYNFTLFQELDDQTFLLDKPGKVSPVFEGPEGYYLIQLVQTWPPRNVPIAEVRDDIRRTLALDHVRHYYAYLLAKLFQTRYVQNNAAAWNYMNLRAPITQIDNLKLSRPDFLRFFGNPVGPSYETRMFDVTRGAGAWAEGEAITQDLVARGQAEHPWIQRARELAAVALKADHVYITRVPPTTYAAGQALQTIRNNMQFIQGLRATHLIEFTVSVKGKSSSAKPQGGLLGATAAAAPPQSEAVAFQNTITGQLSSGMLPTEPTPIKLREWVQKQNGHDAQLDTELEALQTLIDNTPWTGVRIRVKDKDWQDVVPGTAWYESLKNVGIGQVSAPVRLGGEATQYLVLAERPVDMRDWEAKPLLIRALAFQIEASMIFHAEVLHGRQAGNVTYTFQ